MKKVMSFVIAVVVLVCTLWFSVDNATAAGTITYTGAHFVWGKGVAFVFEASGYRNRDVKNANLFIGSNIYRVHCTVNKKEGKIICVAGGGLTRYAGETGILYLAGHAFYVTIPSKPPYSAPPSNPSPACPSGSVLGADVTFFTSDETAVTFFVSGSTLAEVQSSAENMLDGNGFLRSIEAIGNLYCGEVPN